MLSDFHTVTVGIGQIVEDPANDAGFAGKSVVPRTFPRHRYFPNGRKR
jgi:hypothetical protein